MMKKGISIAAVCLIAGVGLFGCGKKPAGGGAPGGWGNMPPPAVKVLSTQLEIASPVRDYIAHVEPIQQANIMAQVEGIIDEVHFQEGTRVKQGDLLFTIDPAPYQAIVEQREAELAQAQASLKRAEQFLTMLKNADKRRVSQSDQDAAEANVAEGQAAVKKAQAALHQASINLGYTQITSPIDGRIGRALITKGNLVSPSSGPLATVIQIDPIRVVIALPDAEYMTLFQRYASDKGYNPLAKVRLANGTVLPDEGMIDFDDNQMDRATERRVHVGGQRRQLGAAGAGIGRRADRRPADYRLGAATRTTDYLRRHAEGPPRHDRHPHGTGQAAGIVRISP